MIFWIPIKGIHNMLYFHEIYINYLLSGQSEDNDPVCYFAYPNFHLKMRLY